MSRLLIGMQHSLLVLESTKSGWKVQESLKNKEVQSVATDPHRPELSFCATYDDGIFRTEDFGQTWRKVGEGIASSQTTAVTVSPLDQRNGFGVLYAGTEPSALYISTDGGDSWEEMEGLRRLPSSEVWSFPPRPHTHHVRWIGSDANMTGFLFVAIEAGALVRSVDRGRTWTDRAPTGPFDTHTLATHPGAAGRVYSSAGDGYFESLDYGATWKRELTGLGHHYLYGLAVDSSDPDTVIASASSSAFEAHYPDAPESLIYRKAAEEESGGRKKGKWNPVSRGLPEPAGTIISILCADPLNGGEFYAVNNRGVFHSSDFGASWEGLEIPWRREFLEQHPWALAVG